MLKFILALLISSPAFASDWSTGDTYRETTYQVLAAVDWLQTRQIAKFQNHCYQHNCLARNEQNSILGKHPTIGEVNNYFLATGVAHYFFAKWLDKYRTPFQYGTIGIELGSDIHNYHLNWKAEF